MHPLACTSAPAKPIILVAARNVLGLQMVPPGVLVLDTEMLNGVWVVHVVTFRRAGPFSPRCPSPDPSALLFRGHLSLVVPTLPSRA